MATSRQFAQRVRRDRERQSRRLLTQFNNKELAQRQRRNRHHLLRQQSRTNVESMQCIHQDQAYIPMQEHLPIACKPLLPQFTDTNSLRHRLDPCYISCSFCGADYWIEERVQGSPRSAPQFSTCCESGVIMMNEFDKPPQPLHSLLTELTPCIFSFQYIN